jgi:hypothetical protein
MVRDLYAQIRERMDLVGAVAAMPPGGMILAATAALPAHLHAAMRRKMGMR